MCKNDTKALIEKCKDFEPQVLLAVARGGLTLSHLMASALNIRDLFVVNSLFYDENKQLEAPNIFNIPDLSKLSKAKKVLIIDDIIDSGTTINEILKILQERFPQIEFKVATIFYKKTAIIKPDFFVRYTDIWVDFFWDVDIK
jgi:xanthine phosphoribosyltransferase